MRSLLSNLVSYWPLHEASGNRADLIGSANTLTAINTPTGAAGVIELASSFASASSQRLDIASNANVQTGDIDFTFAGWMYFDALGAIEYLLSKYNATSGNTEYTLGYASGSGRFEFVVARAVDSAQTATASSFGAPSTATWYFVCGWHDAVADTVNIEINAGVTDSAATGGALQAAGTAQFSIGGNSVLGRYMNGRICEVGFWKRVLTRQERTWLYNNGRGRTYPFDKRLSADSTLGRDGRHRRNRVTGMIT